MVELALGSNFTSFYIDYRLSPEISHPKNTIGSYAILKYIVSKAEYFNIDPKE